MSETRSGWRRARARVLAAGLTIALAPLPLAAAEGDRPAPSPTTLTAAVAKAAATERLSSSTASRAQTAQPAGAPESRGFFKTPLGLAVVAIVGSGTAYAVYSAQHDRIHSAER